MRLAFSQTLGVMGNVVVFCGVTLLVILKRLQIISRVTVFDKPVSGLNESSFTLAEWRSKQIPNRRGLSKLFRSSKASTASFNDSNPSIIKNVMAPDTLETEARSFRGPK